MDVSSAVNHIFNGTAMHTNRASHGARVRAKRTRENPKESPKVPKARTRAKHRKLVSQVLKTRNQRQARKLSNLHKHVPLTTHSWIHDGWSLDEWNNGWSFDEWNDDWSPVGWHEGWEQTYDTSASSFFTWRFGSRLNFGPDRAGDGRFYRTAGGEWTDGGAYQFQGHDENG